MSKVRAIAIYLPQFHPIKENNEWWGNGFTEWTNVTKAKPLFKGHYQPHLPADLGFYDLRLPEVREMQAKLAQEHGIYGFCYYHYWFNGKRILERPFEEVFKSGKPDFPFMLCWANENWTRTWDGGDSEILLEQNYSEEDDKQHINYLIPFFKDDRYIKIDGKPVIAIYRSGILPNVEKTLQTWRNEAKKHNLDLYICNFEGKVADGEQKAFDAAVAFEPFAYLLKYSKDRGFNKLVYISEKILILLKSLFNKSFEYRGIFDYEDFVNWHMNKRIKVSYKQFPGVSPSWDNSARKKRKYILFKNASPRIYKKWFKHILKEFKPFSRDENLIFINAWNEWAEGNHLEPCMKWKSDYLEATKEVLDGVNE